MTTLQLPLPRLSAFIPSFASAATRSAPPEWLDIEMSPEEPIAGLPDFVTPEWFRRNVTMSPTLARRVGEAVRRRRRLDPAFLPWWPEGVAPTAGTAFWFFARAAVDRAESVEFSRLVAAEGKPSGEPVQKALASPFREVYRRCLVDGSIRASLTPAGRDAAFAFAFERGAEGVVAIVEKMIREPSIVPPGSTRLADWFLDRYPETLDLVERALAPEPRVAPSTPKAAPTRPFPGMPEPLTPEHFMDEALTAAEARTFLARMDLDDLAVRHDDLQRELAAVRAGHDPRKALVDEGRDDHPETMPELLSWLETRLPPTVQVLPRAFRSLRKVPNTDVVRLAAGLRFLRDVYVPWRLGRGIDKDRYVTALKEAGFVESASFSDPGSLEAFAGYKAHWNGDVIHLDRHLKRGTGTDPKTMLRIYFTWHKESRTLIVGHMPSHLDNWNS